MAWGAAFRAFNFIDAAADLASGHVNKKAEKEASKYRGGTAVLKGLKIAQFIGKHMDSGESKRKSEREREHVTRSHKKRSHKPRRETYAAAPPERVYTSHRTPAHDSRFRRAPRREAAPAPRASRYHAPEYYVKPTVRHSMHRSVPLRPSRSSPGKHRSSRDVDDLTRSMGGLRLGTSNRPITHRAYPKQTSTPVKSRRTHRTVPASVPKTRYVVYRR